MILGGILGPFEDLLQWVLEALHESIGLPWAWAIVALTLIVRMLLVPLTVRQIHSMQNLQRHAPEMKAIQQKFKHDKMKQREELMRFYQENRINPASSCLPIVFQIPVFIALFFVLRDFADDVLPKYPGSDVGWLGIVPDITDATRSHWSGFLLLAVYALSQLTSSYLMSTTMQTSQRVLLMLLPIFFIPFILSFPSGLMLYWVTTNLWTTGQGLVTRRLMPRPEQPQKRSSRAPQRDDDLGDGAKRTQPKPKPAPTAAQPPRKVKRKKKARR